MDVRARALAQEQRQMARDQLEFHRTRGRDNMEGDEELQAILKSGRQPAPSGNGDGFKYKFDSI